mmetsp:Transcript_68402/g.132084  ORF Transcript_68402/g.132084 Transcript_68402/m.132084 type:complete len:400 (+) Transcript_68402:33-1232(+)
MAHMRCGMGWRRGRCRTDGVPSTVAAAARPAPKVAGLCKGPRPPARMQTQRPATRRHPLPLRNLQCAATPGQRLYRCRWMHRSSPISSRWAQPQPRLLVRRHKRRMHRCEQRASDHEVMVPLRAELAMRHCPSMVQRLYTASGGLLGWRCGLQKQCHRASPKHSPCGSQWMLATFGSDRGDCHHFSSGMQQNPVAKRWSRAPTSRTPTRNGPGSLEPPAPRPLASGVFAIATPRHKCHRRCGRVCVVRSLQISCRSIAKALAAAAAAAAAAVLVALLALQFAATCLLGGSGKLLPGFVAAVLFWHWCSTWRRRNTAWTQAMTDPMPATTCMRSGRSWQRHHSCMNAASESVQCWRSTWIGSSPGLGCENCCGMPPRCHSVPCHLRRGTARIRANVARLS